MLSFFFEKDSLINHINILMLHLSIGISEVDCIINKYKHICQYLYNYSDEYQYMLIYIDAISARSIGIMNKYVDIMNTYHSINLKSKSISYLKTMINEILHETRLLEEEYDEIEAHYIQNVKNHYDYIKGDFHTININY